MIIDRFECTGLDGFLRVNGVWGNPHFAPRLVLNRGPLESIQRDLPRDFESVEARIVKEVPLIAKQSKESYALARDYLDLCDKVSKA